MKVDDGLRNADILAEFANLEPSQVAAFRQDHCDNPNEEPFSPASFWPEGRTGLPAMLANELGPTWEQYQDLLRSAWANGAKAWKARKEGFPLEQAIRLISSSGFLAQNELYVFGTTYPYQRAVMFLYENPWRVKICEECGARFVSSIAWGKYCSVAKQDPNNPKGYTNCSAIFRKKYRTNYAREHDWNHGSRKTKQKARR